jgi:cobalt transporter subunit CbtB
MTTQVSDSGSIPAASARSVLAQALAALMFGLVIIVVVGFAPMGIAHNAAHDVRHSAAFPCH